MAVPQDPGQRHQVPQPDSQPVLHVWASVPVTELASAQGKWRIVSKSRCASEGKGQDSAS
jgi:hypothetical protein